MERIVQCFEYCVVENKVSKILGCKKNMTLRLYMLLTAMGISLNEEKFKKRNKGYLSHFEKIDRLPDFKEIDMIACRIVAMNIVKNNSFLLENEQQRFSYNVFAEKYVRRRVNEVLDEINRECDIESRVAL